MKNVLPISGAILAVFLSVILMLSFNKPEPEEGEILGEGEAVDLVDLGVNEAEGETIFYEKMEVAREVPESFGEEGEMKISPSGFTKKVRYLVQVEILSPKIKIPEGKDVHDLLATQPQFVEFRYLTFDYLSDGNPSLKDFEHLINLSDGQEIIHVETIKLDTKFVREK